MLSASACKTWVSSSASPYMRSSGMTCNASSSRPGFSYFVGVVDKVMSRFLNFCDSLSVAAGGVGIFGKFLNDEYDGGVRPACDVDDCDDDDGPAVVPVLLEDGEPGAGEPCRERERSKSFNRFVFNNRSKRCLKSFAHSSPYSSSPGPGPFPFEAMTSSG